MPDPRKTTMLDALDLLARVEGQSRVLRGLGRKSRPVLVQGRFAIARYTPRDGLPFALPDAAVAMDGAAWVRADVLIVGRVPTRRLILRAFYADVGITVAIHGRLRLSRRSALLRGARVARRLHGRGTLAIPEQRERGRRPRHAWAVEELLSGREVVHREWETTVVRLADELAALWLASPVAARPIRRLIAPIPAAKFRTLLVGLEVEPSEPERLSREVERLTGSDQQVFVGPTQGDPVQGNVLRMADGRLALIDWDKAGSHPFGLDAVRMVVGVADPFEAIARLDDRFRSLHHARMATWSHQLAVGMLSILPNWAEQMVPWDRIGAFEAHRKKLARRIHLLERLLLDC